MSKQRCPWCSCADDNSSKSEEQKTEKRPTWYRYGAFIVLAVVVAYVSYRALDDAKRRTDLDLADRARDFDM